MCSKINLKVVMVSTLGKFSIFFYKITFGICDFSKTKVFKSH